MADVSFFNSHARTLRIFLVPVVLFFVALFCYSCASGRALRRHIAEADRDPITGIIRGAEAVTLEPQALGDGTPAPHRTPRTACLLIHGFVGSRKDFADLGDRLAKKGFTVRLMRLPGHGTTPVDFAFQPPGALLRGVRAEYRLLRERFEAVYVIGFSMGGALATLLAADEPVARLVLISPYYGVTYAWYYVLPPETWIALTGWAVKYVVKFDRFIKVNDRSVAGKLFSYKVVPTAGVRQLIDLGREARRGKVLEKVTCPVLVVQSKGDMAASPSRTRKAFEQIGSSRKTIAWFERSNHHILWDYDSEEAKEKIVQFLLSPDGSSN